MTEESPRTKALAATEAAALNYSGPDRVVSASEFLLENNTKSVVPKIKTGFPSLDEYFGGGLARGELIVVSGPTKHGKSTLCLTLARNIKLLNVNSLWFSFEMPPDILFGEIYRGLSVFLPLSMKHKNIDWIGSKIVEAKLKYDCRAVFIDHLHYVVDMRSLKNSSLEIGAVVRDLKLFAVNHNVVIFLIAHIGKESRETPRAPNEQDIRDSSFVTQEADSTVMVHRWFKDKTSGKIYRSDTESKIVVCNHRRTGMFDRKFTARLTDGFLEERGSGNVDQIIEDEPPF